MDKSIIKQVQNFGFEVYMRDMEKDRHMFFTDGNNIGCLEDSPLKGICLSTVHQPNCTSGTGYDITQDVAPLTKEALEACFMFAPDWASRDSREATRKWTSMSAFLKRNSHNQGYKLVPKVSE